MEKESRETALHKIKDFYFGKRRMPSYSEMLGIFRVKSKNAAFKKVQKLVKEGFLEKDISGRLIPGKVFGVLKVLGFVRAGFPSPAEEELVDTMNLDEYLISSPQATYLLKVDGDSMLDAGIHPKDLVLVQKNLSPRNGDIVVACVDKEWTLKYFEKHKGKVLLRAANKKYPDIYPQEELIIAGVVIANVRKYR
ncbi:MAG: LexA family transcriptional regulator [Candidatus Omnitrophota bacterium]